MLAVANRLEGDARLKPVWADLTDIPEAGGKGGARQPIQVQA